MPSDGNHLAASESIKHQAVERFLELIEDSGLPVPDAIERGEHEVRFMWNDRKVAVVIDLDDHTDGSQSGALRVAA